jgi:hypothetical protein
MSTKDIPTPLQCIEVMKNGTSMLKCTKRGKRHFLHFQLSDDMKRLTWKSPAKDSTEASSMSPNLISQEKNKLLIKIQGKKKRKNTEKPRKKKD